jgi:dTDP-4-dehydrorhamnose reductase
LTDRVGQGEIVAFEERRRLVIVGAGGMLGQMIQEQTPNKFKKFPLKKAELDLTDQVSVFKVLREIKPDVIINCAAYTDVDGAETEEVEAFKVNGEGPAHLADFAHKNSAMLFHVSTDFVFDGKKRTPYLEEDSPHPLSVYGCSKLQGEQEILKSDLEKFFIIRTSWLYGPGGNNFVETIFRLAREREELRIVADQLGTPTYTEDLAKAVFTLLALADDGEKGEPQCLKNLFGLYHFSNQGECSWYEFALKIISLLRENGELLKVDRVLPIRTQGFPLPARRPSYSVLSKMKYQSVTKTKTPFWEDSLRKYLSGCKT